MTVLQIAKSGPSQIERAADASEKIKSLIYDNLEGLPIALAVGVLEIVKLELLMESDNDAP